ncbi:class F sortase [Nocardioides sp. AE5]|uniref:class F sortase n=1 Tax=Nocardioides sp. AE5 TaxID=2962573 RepID=UPI0028822FF9|nr:class F sortase [Nocardioides sp. AE5]MDT0203430.1 class F sortase [Nocardioides sp. AE5]
MLAALLLGGAVFAGFVAFRSATAPDLPPPAAPLPGGDLSDVQRHVAASPGGPLPEEMGPDTVLVPQLRVQAPLMQVGVRQSDVVVPFDAQKVGVYKGAAPLTAAQGTTTLVGHVTNGAELGAFYPLAGAESGMRIWTRDGAGAPQEWVVQRVVTYPRTVLPDELFAVDGPRRLVLITCGGEVRRVGSARHYAENVVVEAVPAIEPTSHDS